MDLALLSATPLFAGMPPQKIASMLACLDTEELHALLGPELSLAEPELVLWIRDYLQEQEALLQEQKGM